MKRVKHAILAATVLKLAFLAIWYSAVRAVPGVRRRKAAARAARGA